MRILWLVFVLYWTELTECNDHQQSDNGKSSKDHHIEYFYYNPGILVSWLYIVSTIIFLYCDAFLIKYDNRIQIKHWQKSD